MVICPADVDRLVSSYCSSWNEPDSESRLRRLRAIWHEDSTFDSPAVHVHGLRAMNAHIDACGAARSGWRFVVVGMTAHGHHFHLSWKLVDSTGRERLAGYDVGEYAADQRLHRVVSFWRTEAAG